MSYHMIGTAFPKYWEVSSDRCMSIHLEQPVLRPGMGCDWDMSCDIIGATCNGSKSWLLLGHEL